MFVSLLCFMFKGHTDQRWLMAQIAFFNPLKSHLKQEKASYI